MIMGRLQKKKIDKILQMLGQNFTGLEISKEVGCSISTVYRIKKMHACITPKSVESSNYRINVELAKALCDVLLTLEFLPFLSEENIGCMTRDIAKNLITRLAEIDPKLVRSVLEDSSYYDYLRPIIIAKPVELEQQDIFFRREWIELLRKYWPDILAEFIV